MFVASDRPVLAVKYQTFRRTACSVVGATARFFAGSHVRNYTPLNNIVKIPVYDRVRTQPMGQVSTS